ncbi:hypothetical protein LCGC14_0147350 [marine sediment metagenome]|uniref:Uncharacterized protein n=1 Tax=marine sediment metagenome TaxID=412755 RepID=A0A0F9Y1T2_9ZZZZ
MAKLPLGPRDLSNEKIWSEAQGRYSQVSNIEEELHSLGLELPTLPHALQVNFIEYTNEGMGQPKIPTDISRLTLSQISTLQSVFAEWFEYVVILNTKFNVQLSALEEVKDLTWAAIRKEHTDKSMTVSDKNDAVRTDIRYVEINAEYLKMKYLHNVVKGIATAMERGLKVISREITIRSSSYDTSTKMKSPEAVKRGLTKRSKGVANTAVSRRGARRDGE